METWVFVGVGAVICVIFAGIWLLDARRAKKVENDPERVDVDSSEPADSGRSRRSRRPRR